MDIRNVRHKGLKAFIERGITKGLPAAQIGKIRDIVTFLIEAESLDEVFALAKYKPHRLSANRSGTFSLSVTANWRMTFSHDPESNEVADLDFEDYH